MVQPFDLVIEGGTVVTVSEFFVCDVGVRGGRIAALGADLARYARDRDAVIDAHGKYVLPGGIDAHVHLDEPAFMGVKLADDFRSGTRSAIAGGTTTVLSFVTQEKDRSLRAVIDEYHEKARGRAHTDYGFHIILADPTPQVLGQDLPALVADGYSSFKVYMAYDGYVLDDRQMLDVFEACRQHGAFPMVHAENHHCLHWLRSRAIAAGDTALCVHARSALAPVEREAAHRAIALAEIARTPMLIVHMSTADAVEQLRWARRRGLPVHGETCPQYLMLSQADLERPGAEGAKFLCSPPPRTGADQGELWDALIRGTIDVYSSDHCAYVFAGEGGKLNKGPNPAFHQVPPGVPGIEVRLPLLFSEGVMAGRIDVHRFVAVTATNPAKLYGLFPRKGSLHIGADADIAIWDPHADRVIRHDMLHDGTDYTPYEEMPVRGWPIKTILRGQVVFQDDRLSASIPHGEFIARSSSGRML